MTEDELVWIAAAASATDPADVLAGTDVAALARLLAVAEAETDPTRTAAALLVGIVTQRPFPRDNRAAAVLAALWVLPAARNDDVDELVALVDAVEQGHAGIAEVAVHLAAPDRSRRLPRPCPDCRRPLHLRSTERVWTMVGVSRFELVARCVSEHGAHGRRDEPSQPRHTTDVDAGWRPVVTGPDRTLRLVLADDGPVLLDLGGDGPHVEATPLDHLDATDLVGSWERLRSSTRGTERRHLVPRERVRLDDSGRLIDWRNALAAV